MKKLLVTAALALAVFDAVALYVWLEHKKKAAAQAAAPVEAAPAPEPAPPVDPTASERSASDPAPAPAASVPCGSAESCRAYCQDPANKASCDAMAARLREEAAAQADAQPAADPAAPALDPKFKEALDAASPTTLACLNKALGRRTVAALRSGEAHGFDPAKGPAVERCFRRGSPRRPRGGGGRQPGPGGCSSEQACIAYCSNPAHRSECLASPAIPEQFKAMIRQFPQQ